MLNEYMISRFDGAMTLLPYGLRERFDGLSEREKADAEELRLRIGRPPSALTPNGELPLPGEPVSRRDLDGALELVTRASAHSVRSSMAHGFVTAAGGYRVGFCGTAISDGGELTGYRSISSVAVRISREIAGAADSIIDRVLCGGTARSMLILSPPGLGKTTLLRDAVRQISDAGIRVSLADERGEIAAMYNGAPQMDVGSHTDVLDSCPKAKAVLLLLRAMNPEVIALDEITAPEDISAVESAANCGVKLLATAHASGIPDLKARQLYRRMLKLGIFERLVVISRGESGCRTYACADMEA